MVRMTLAKFEIFRSVVELGSLSKAAEALNLTQSAVSHTIASLESDFGFTLLTRGRSGISLTSNGERILLYIREILKWNEQMIQEAAKINGLETGIVRIGTFPSVSVQWLPTIIKQFSEIYPSIDIRLFEGDYNQINNWILDGTIDFGFLSLPTANTFDIIPLKRDKLLCLLPDSHPLCRQKVILFSQIENEPFIMPKSNIDNDVRRIFKAYKVKPKIQYEISEDQAIISMVQNNLGISILPEMILYRIPDTVRIVELEGNHYRSIGIAATLFKKISPGAKKFIDFIQDWLKE